MEKGRSLPCAFMVSDNTTMESLLCQEGPLAPPSRSCTDAPSQGTEPAAPRQDRVLALGRRLCALLGGPPSPQLPGGTLQSLCLVD